MSKINDFMLGLMEDLKRTREIEDSTAQQYIQSLWILNGRKVFKTLAWTKNYDAVQAIIDTYAPSTQTSYYTVLSSVLSLHKDTRTYKKPYEHWSQKLAAARSEERKADPHEMTDKQKENWMDWEEVLKKHSELGDALRTVLSQKHLTAEQYDNLLQWVIVSLYVLVPPRRNQDYNAMYVVKKWSDSLPTDRNYLDLTGKRFLFNSYKTSKKYGRQEVEVPDALMDILGIFLKHHPLYKTRGNTEARLLVDRSGAPLNAVNGITRVLNKVFKKKVGSSMLRHSFLTSKYGEDTEARKVQKEREATAEAMGHSTAIAESYIKDVPQNETIRHQ
jgi:hypothetical protein